LPPIYRELPGGTRAENLASASLPPDGCTCCIHTERVFQPEPLNSGLTANWVSGEGRGVQIPAAWTAEGGKAGADAAHPIGGHGVGGCSDGNLGGCGGCGYANACAGDPEL
jgi:hypothetical protein